MFNFQLLKRSVLNTSYKYLVCMILIISGVYISVCAYNTEFVLVKADEGFIFKELLKITLICYGINLLNKSKSGFIAGAFMLIYTGIAMGTYIMFVINNMSFIKLLISVLPITVKSLAAICIYSDMFVFEYSNNIKKLLAGGVVYFIGDVLLAVML